MSVQYSGRDARLCVDGEPQPIADKIGQYRGEAETDTEAELTFTPAVEGRAFAGGVLSGVVEPIGAVVTILAAQLVIPALPYLLSFAAGAMLYVVVEELIPEMSQGRHSNLGTVFFAVGFSVMMVLDVALG